MPITNPLKMISTNCFLSALQILHFVRQLKIYLLLLAIVAFFSCCKSNSTEPVDSKKELIAKSWQAKSAYDISTVPGSKVDVLKLLPFTTLTINSDGTYLTPLSNGKWELAENDTKVILDKGLPNQFILEIVELSKSTFTVKFLAAFATPVATWEVSFIPASNSINANPELNFETLWKEFDLRYSFFEIKKINWDSLYSFYRPKINSTTSSADLFNTMASMLKPLKDAHVSLISPFAAYYYDDWKYKNPYNFISKAAVNKFLSADYGKLAGGYLKYGEIENSIGYIYIGPNLTGDASAWSAAIDMIVDKLKNCKGIIVDIRNNTGGNDGLGKVVAGRFTTEEKIYSYIKWRNGPKHSNFTDYISSTIVPLGNYQFTKPVALLTNRKCLSSAEGTILMFRALPNVTIIGDTTAGASANPIELTLPNSWTYRVSRWIQYTADKKYFENIGLAPDIPIQISKADYDAGNDKILERAIQFIKGK